MLAEKLSTRKNICSNKNPSPCFYRYGKISTQTSKRGKVRISNTDGKEGGEEAGAAAGEVDSDDDFEADMAVELKERVQVLLL